MKVRWIVWKDIYLEKIQRKHSVTPEEVEQVFSRNSIFRKAEKGKVTGEDLYVAYGRSEAGRYLTVVFIIKQPNGALPISARNMTKAERRYYEKRKKIG